MTTQTIRHNRVDATRLEGTPTWWLVFVHELKELWMGGKAPVLIFIFSILLGIMTYVMASNSELSLIPPQEMVYETLKAAISVALIMSIIIGADSISGERERFTLEGLLLTPASRRQIVVGKFLAGMTAWPAAFLISIPYMYVLAQGNEVFDFAVPWGALTGTILAPAFLAIGMLTSFWTNSNKTSLFTGLGISVLFLLPTQLPGTAQTGFMGSLLQQANPIAATYHFASKILVNNRTLEEWWPWLISPVALAVLVYILLFWYASPSLRLEGGKAGKVWLALGRLVGVGTFICFLGSSLAIAQEGHTADEKSRAAVVHQNPLHVTIDMDYKKVKAGDHILYNTVVTNNGTAPSAPLCLAMNIVNLDAAGDIVDPEDWSPQRTQYVDVLEAGKSVTHSWRVNAILEGDYLVYMVVIPVPDGENATSEPVVSTGIHLIVTPFTKLNPGGVLPYAIGGPLVLILALVLLYRIRRRNIDTGASSP